MAQQPQQWTVVRARTLPNMAAGFVETRAGQDVVRQVVTVGESSTTPRPRFLIERDAFVAKSEVTKEVDPYKPSAEQMDRFQKVLKSFCTILKKRKLDQKLGIKLKDPKDYKLTDVVLVAQKIKERNENSEKARSSMRVIRKCFKAARKHRSTILAFVPNDSYGFVISGGLTMILAGIEDYEKLQSDIHTALLEIPRKLDAVQRLSDVHMESARLHEYADAVLVSIFVVLERIIDRLSMSFSEKLVSKVKGHGDDIREALDTLDSDIKAFQEEVNVCADERMGRMERRTSTIDRNVLRVNLVADDIKEELEKMKEDHASLKIILQNQQKYLEGQEQTFHERVQAEVWNRLYRFLASDPDFNPVDGTFDQERAREYARSILSSDQKRIGGIPNAVANFADKNQKLVDRWFSQLGSFDPDPSNDITECINSIETIGMREKDKIQWMMNSGEIYEWLSTSKSCTLEVTAETAPENIMNSITITSALLCKTLVSATSFPVLAFFCGIRTNDAPSEQANSRALLKSLNGQLLRFIQKCRPTIDLSFLSEKDYAQKALFKRLLHLFPKGDAVFITIDSFSRISGSNDDAKKLLETLCKSFAEVPDLTIKLLVTDTLSNCSVKRWANSSLHVPDFVEGDRDGINIDFVKKESKLAIQEFKVGKEDGKEVADIDTTSEEGTSSDFDSEVAGW